MLICEEVRPKKLANHSFDVFHLGMEEHIEVKASAKIICDQLGMSPKFCFGEGRRGWVGDNPFVFLDISKIKSLGWQPTHTIEESIRETASWVAQNNWLFHERR